MLFDVLHGLGMEQVLERLIVRHFARMLLFLQISRKLSCYDLSMEFSFTTCSLMCFTALGWNKCLSASSFVILLGCFFFFRSQESSPAMICLWNSALQHAL